MSVKKLSIKKFKRLKGGDSGGIACTYSSNLQTAMYGDCTHAKTISQLTSAEKIALNKYNSKN